MSSQNIRLKQLCAGIPNPLPPLKERSNKVPHAPYRNHQLSDEEKKISIKNALRYFPSSQHSILADEFAKELADYGHIYMYRLIPDIEMKAYPINEYPCKTKSAAAIMLMIMNNLDHRVAQFPHELVTYGGNGQVFSNWAQFLIAMNYLSRVDEDQTLTMCSGHPQGIFPSSPTAPRLVITNGMVIPNYSSPADYNRMFAMGVSMYGQMTAGSYCYIGPQGIVHGTTITIINAGRKYLKTNDLSGKVFITSGLGGMSGAQGKAAVISGCIGVIAEIDETALNKRYVQGWINAKTSCLDELVRLIKHYRKTKTAISIGYHGHIVDVWERMVEVYRREGVCLVDLGSDQTSCHVPFNGGYYPVGMSVDQSQQLMHNDHAHFKKLVQKTLVRHVEAINELSKAGMYFWDYGNAFLLEASNAGGKVLKPNASSPNDFIYPSYVQHIMGDIFSLGFGPFRWVCASGSHDDLLKTDKIAAEVIKKLMNEKGVSSKEREQYEDNLKWIEQADEHKLVVGSQARILYSNQKGRVAMAIAFNQAIKTNKLSGPVILSRDHHDVSGTDSPYRETSNVYDGSAFCADMSVQNFVGDSFRGATWVALHNGGGCGWGEVMNGGFGMILDGTDACERKAISMLNWDVSNGVARRAWTGNQNAIDTIKKAMDQEDKLVVTMPQQVKDDSLIERSLKSAQLI